MGRRLVGIDGNLSKEALNQNTRAWKMVPKFHMFEHVCSQATKCLAIV